VISDPNGVYVVEAKTRKSEGEAAPREPLGGLRASAAKLAAETAKKATKKPSSGQPTKRTP